MAENIEPRRSSKLPLIVVVLVGLTGAAFAFRDQLNLPELWKLAGKDDVQATAGPGNGQPAEQPSRLAALPDLSDLRPSPPPTDGPGFDIARIAPEGVSVFAGRAEPNSHVTVLADGKPIGTAKVDSNGEWTLAVEEKFASNDPKLALQAAPEGQQVAAAPEPPTAAVPASEVPKRAEQRAAGAKAAENVTSGMIRNLERLVEEARKNDQQARSGTAATPPPAPQPPVASASKEPARPVQPSSPPAKVAAAEPPAATRQATANDVSPTSIPVPITFEYRTSTFTSEGRRAAQLLGEYLKLKGSREVSLTGHADERGTDDLNMNLSQQRLDAVAALLRESGYTGKMDLEAKGKREPFTGVDRSQYPREALYQLDRRVELRLAQ